MILAIDMGNTNIVIGAIDNEKTYFVERVTTNHGKTDLEYAVNIKSILEIHDIPLSLIDGAIVSSVVPPLNATILSSVKKIFGFKPLLVGSGIDSEGNPAANPKDIASYYVMREGVDLVYAVPKENLPWVGVKPSQVITSLVILPNIASVDRVELELEGKKHTLQITQTPNPEEPDDPQKNDFTFTMDGAATDEDMSRKFYQLLLSTGIQDVNLTERERYILLAHVLDERDFTALAGELGLGYKGTAAIYYRAVQKVRRSMGGGEV